MKRIGFFLLACAGAWAQGPTVSPLVVPTFSYTINSGSIPAAQTVKVTLPSAVATLPVQVSNAKAASVACDPSVSSCGWLQVTPDQGHAPLTLTVSVNPTSLPPGSYAGSFLVDTLPSSGKLAVTVSVSLQVTNPPSQLMVSSSSGNWTAATAAGSVGNLAFSYTTGSDASTLATSVLSVSSTGDIIPFNVAVANSKGSGSGGSGSAGVWLRVSSTSATAGAAVTTSGSAGVGSLFPVFVTIDYSTLQGLAIGQYFATITITPATSNAKLNVPQVVTASLVVSAGPPTVSTVFPGSLTPAQPVDPTFTVYGTNFTANTSVFLDVYITPDPANPNVPLAVSHQIPWSSLTLVSAKILQAKITSSFLPAAPAGISYPYLCAFRIQNGGFDPVTTTFWVTDPNAPTVSFVVNAASYQQASKFTGTSASDPALANPTATTVVSPRGVISIFGQNLGPSVVSTAWPVAAAGAAPSFYDTTWNSMRVKFTYTDPTTGNPAPPAYAPILMVSVNQINAIVPQALSAVLVPGAITLAKLTVVNTTTGQSSVPFPVTVLAEDPGIFTFGGVGQGQGAIINYDANGAATVNSSANQEPRGNIVALFATGLGVLTNDATIPDGALTSVSAPGVKLADASSVRVFVGGQPAVVLYAGTSPGAVAGLVQVNTIIPPTSSTGAVSIQLSIGDTTVTRQAQSGVTVAVKQ